MPTDYSQKVLDTMRAMMRAHTTGGAVSFAAEPETGELFIYGPIWEDDLFEGVSSKTVAAGLAEMGGRDLTVRINSPGGAAHEGIAIHNLLADYRAKHKASVQTLIDGDAMSAATLVMMAGRPTRAAENAVVMLHNPWMLAAGGADDMRAAAKFLDLTRDRAILTYQRRTGLDREKLGDWMDAETYFLAGEAKEAGLVDAVEPAGGVVKTTKGGKLLGATSLIQYDSEPERVAAIRRQRKADEVLYRQASVLRAIRAALPGR